MQEKRERERERERERVELKSLGRRWDFSLLVL
jgi:hypothetical protein